MITPASPAPEDTPTICGSASGFFITACNIAPDTARQAPTKAATILRGNRIFQIICEAVSVNSLDHNVLHISASDTGVEPQIRDIIIQAITAISKTMITDKRKAFRSLIDSIRTPSPYLHIQNKSF